MRGNRLAVGGPSPKVYSLGLRDEEWSLPKNFTDIQGLRWGSDGRLLGWSEDTVWVVSDAEPLRLHVPQGPGQEVRCAEWQPGQEWVAVCTYNALYAWQPLSGRLITVTEELDTPEIGTVERGAVWSADGRRLGGRGAKLALWDSKQPSAPASVFYEAEDVGQALTFAFWLPDDRSLVAGWFPPLASSLELQLWNADGEGIETMAVEGDFSEHSQVRAIYAPDSQDGAARLLLWSGEGLLAIYTPCWGTAGAGGGSRGWRQWRCTFAGR